MTARSLISKPDLIRAAEAAKLTGCRIDIKISDTLISIFPDAGNRDGEETHRIDGIDYGKPVM